MMNFIERRSGILKSLGPGLIWAGAAIGVSHLVQSSRAGASYGFMLVWVVIVANLLKYPFFEFGPRYAAARRESLLDGYRRIGIWALWLFFVITIASMFTIMAAVTIVTAGLVTKLIGFSFNLVWVSGILMTVCALILIIGRYAALDKLVKIIIIVLTLSTITALIAAIFHGSSVKLEFVRPILWDGAGLAFIVALVGWMPSAFDIAVWNSLWTLERSKQTGHEPTVREALFDFNLGYIGTSILALCFLSLGALVMYGTGENFSPRAGVFAGQLISLYTNTLGNWSYYIILIAAFTTMFSTTLTVVDGFPRVLHKTSEILFPNLAKLHSGKWLYWVWMAIIIVGAITLLALFMKSMRFMVDLATTISFVTAPILAILNYRVVTSPLMPLDAQPPKWLKVLSWIGMIFLLGFSLAYLGWKFF